MKIKEALELDRKKLTAPLTVSVESGQLIVRIGLQTLQRAAENGETFNPFNETENDFKRAFKITNLVTFGTGVRRFLEEEEEDGSTVITRALDEGIISAVENDYGVDEIEQEKP